MSKNKDTRGRKPLPLGKKKPPQPTLKINEALYPFVKLLKREFKAKRVDADKLAALTRLLLEETNDPDIEKSTTGSQEDNLNDLK